MNIYGVQATLLDTRYMNIATKKTVHALMKFMFGGIVKQQTIH